MSLLDKLFPKKQHVCHRKMPTWEEIVDHMQGKELSFFADTIVRIIVSKNRAKRIIILQSDHGYYKTVYEEIRVWDEDEWNYFCNDPDRYPAYWEPVASSINSKSFYGTEDDAIKAVTDSHEYKTYFV
ncbi:MAG: hypothetical protein IJ001_05050 [Oscillospiraceae bacterium]|nr:hypothetical protein [Oscillospiraceae bacterium]